MSFLSRLFARRPDAAPAARMGARSGARSLASTIFVVLLLRAFVVSAYEIPSGSMIPTLQVGDRIWVNKLVYGVRLPFTDIKLGTGFRPPRRGEIIVFSHPKKPQIDLIKRVVAVGGDTIEMRDQVLFINGQPMPRTPSDEPTRYLDYDEEGDRWFERQCVPHREQIGEASFTTLGDPVRPMRSFPPRRVPEGSLFVMGDNRDNSSDSRYWDFVPLNLVRGRAMVVWWSQGGPDGVRLSRFGHLIE
jgi:signal peptidase I